MSIMWENEARVKTENKLFNFGTTHKTDFRRGEIYEPVHTTYKPKPAPKPKTKLPPLKNVHTISNWRDGKILPFSLFHRPKDIVRTSPTQLQEPFEKPVDAGLENAKKTRPRLVMTPSISIDDIDDPRARGILLDFMYTSETSKAMRESVATYFSVKAPLPTLPASSYPISVTPLLPPAVPAEWKRETIDWDRKQVRSFVPSDRDFWLRKKPRCRACDETAAVAAHRNMERQRAVKGRF